MRKLSSLKNAIVLFAAILIGMASVQAATITVSSAAESAGVNYNTIQAAYNYIKDLGAVTPISEAYVIEIQSTYAGEVAYPISFTAIAGASAINNITIKPATGAKITISNPAATVVKNGLTTTAAATVDVLDATGIQVGQTIFGTATNTASAFPTVTNISGTTITAGTTNFVAKPSGTASLFFGTPGTKTITFTGATYVTIDGVSRTGTTGLTIQNPNNIVANTLYFDGATYNTIKNCYIKGANISGNAYNSGNNGQIYFTGVSNYNVIENNDVCDIDGNIMPINMFFFGNTGSSTDATIINTVQNNNIYNFNPTTATPVGNAGAFNFPSSATPNTWVLNNRIYWTKTLTATYSGSNTTFFLIGFGSSSAGKLSRIEGNYIGGTASDGTGIATFTPAGSVTITVINGQSNFTVKNNQIFNISSSLPNGINGIVIGSSYTNADAGDISGNTIRDITVTSAGNNAAINAISRTPIAATFSRNVTNNIIYNLTATGASIANRMLIRGIYMQGTCTSNSNFTGNTIYNFTAGDPNSTSNNFAIAMDLQLYTSVVEKNLIYNINVLGTTAVTQTKTAYGIRITGSNNVSYNSVSGTEIKNNIIRLGTQLTDNPAMIYGIYQAAATTITDPCKIYNNTVYIGGSASSTATIANSSYAFFRTGTVPVNDIRNNIFSNQRLVNGGAANQYAFSVAAPADVATMTKNLYQYNGKLGAIGTGSVTTYADLTEWNTARAAVTPTALSTDASLDNVVPGFADATAVTPDLHLSVSSPANQSGVVIASVTDDYSGLTRADYTPADMGAYAIAGSTNVENTRNSQSNIYTVNKALVFDNLNGSTAHIYGITGQLLNSIAINSDKVSVAIVPGIYFVKVNAINAKMLVK